jgi:HKD family nuclease
VDIVFSKEILQQLEKELNNTKDDVQIISAFCKESILKFIHERLANSVSKKRLLVRFTLADILTGATDAGLYNFCEKHGWDMYVLTAR